MKILVFIVILLGAFGTGLFGQTVESDTLKIQEDKNENSIVAEQEVQDSTMQDSILGFLSEFLVPGNGGKVISSFGPRAGRMHYGTDIKMPYGDTVRASFDGLVTKSGYSSGFGNIIVLEHENKISTYYAHFSGLLVKKGSFVSRGDAIGLAGNSGRARGSHLHFEIRENNVAFNSEIVFDYDNQILREEALLCSSLAELRNVIAPELPVHNTARPEYYNVKSGDSLWRIARIFQTSISVLCKLNNISEDSILRVGQVLRLY